MKILITAVEGINNATDEMPDLLQECGLVDTHLLSDANTQLETYVRGKGKKDYCLVTKRVQQCIRYSHIVPYNETIVSDRRALIVDIDYQTLDKGDMVYWQGPERTIQRYSTGKIRIFVKVSWKKG